MDARTPRKSSSSRKSFRLDYRLEVRPSITVTLLSNKTQILRLQFHLRASPFCEVLLSSSACCVLLHPSSAFYVMDHTVFLNWLYQVVAVSVSALACFKSHLTERDVFLLLLIMSEKPPLFCGVLQGSFLELSCLICRY